MMEKSPFYDMLRNMWVLGNVEKEALLKRVPRFISQFEYNEIIALPQDGVIPLDNMTGE